MTACRANPIGSARSAAVQTSTCSMRRSRGGPRWGSSPVGEPQVRPEGVSRVKVHNSVDARPWLGQLRRRRGAPRATWVGGAAVESG